MKKLTCPLCSADDFKSWEAYTGHFAYSHGFYRAQMKNGKVTMDMEVRCLCGKYVRKDGGGLQRHLHQADSKEGLALHFSRGVMGAKR